MEFPNIIDPNEEAKWKEAGRLTAIVREFARETAKEGMKIIDFSTIVEKKIKEMGADLAFPINISFNEIAAHDAADIDDERVFGKDVVKIDIGVSKDGYVGDTAFTIDFSKEHENLVLAAEEALKNAIKLVREGIKLGEIGKTIQQTIEGYGYTPVVNLSGHGIARYQIHTAPSVPNYDTKSNVELKENMIIAIEPFATKGVGKIEERGKSIIFSQIAKKNVRSPYGRKILRAIERFNGLPFSIRDINENKGVVALGIRELLSAGIIRTHEPLVEVSGGLVAQAEHTVLVKRDGCIILTE